MRVFCQVILLLLLLSLGQTTTKAASKAENTAFGNAVASAQVEMWERAEKQFAEFVELFPKSDRRMEAVLFEAQARFKQTNSAGVIQLLSTNLTDAGNLADKFQFWIAEAHFQNSNFIAAAEAYGKLNSNFTNSPLLLQSSYSQALARKRLNDRPAVISLLSQPGAFRTSARNNPTNEFVIRGNLLLAEAQLAEKQFTDAERTLENIKELKPSPEFDYQRQLILFRVDLASRGPLAALSSASNLVDVARATGRPDIHAESVAFQAGLLEQLNRADEAIAVYEKNVSTNWPAEQRREALLKIVGLSLVQNHSEDAVQKLESFLKQNPSDPAADMAVLTIGELRLKEYSARIQTNSPATNAAALEPATNLLALSESQFDRIINVYTNSNQRAKAYFDRGWCFWLSGQFSNSLADFSFAAARLPISSDQVIARFKMGDCQFALGGYHGAVTNFLLVTTGYSSLRFAQDELVEPALYQTVRASLKYGDQNLAISALKQIMETYPQSFVSECAVLLTGQDLNRTGNSVGARKVFTDFIERITNSTLMPQIQLAVARTYEHEGDWTRAIEIYDTWLATLTNHPSQAKATFDRAWATYQSGNETNAFMQFTNFVSVYSTNGELAPLAQNWIGDYFFREGDYQNAEFNYRKLIQTWPNTPLARPAAMMAGRAAMARDELALAASYFTNLINDLQCPPDILGEAMFAQGDTWMKRGNIEQALGTFEKIPQLPLLRSNYIVPLANGRIADCYSQLAAQNPEYFGTYFGKAIDFYKMVLDSPQAGVSARSQAEVGMGIVLEKLAEREKDADKMKTLKQDAINHFANVALKSNLLDGEKEKADLFWVNYAERLRKKSMESPVK